MKPKQIIDLSIPIANANYTGFQASIQYWDHDEGARTLGKSLGLAQDDFPEGKALAWEEYQGITHMATHLDAPWHFGPTAEGKPAKTIDQVPLEKIVKKGRIVPLTDTEPGGPVTADAVLATGVEIDASIIPILHTGWTEKTWGTDDFWDNMTYLDTSISELMIERGVSAVAIDCFPEIPFWRDGMERDTSKPPGPNHRALLGNNTIIIQMLTNISAIVGEDNFTLVAVPLRLEGLDGSPARVFAMVG